MLMTPKDVLSPLDKVKRQIGGWGRAINRTPLSSSSFSFPTPGKLQLRQGKTAHAFQESECPAVSPLQKQCTVTDKDDLTNCGYLHFHHVNPGVPIQGKFTQILFSLSHFSVSTDSMPLSAPTLLPGWSVQRCGSAPRTPRRSPTWPRRRAWA